MATPDEQQTKAKHYRNAYNAAIGSKVKIGDDELQKVLNDTTRGGQNSLLHLAAGVGNLPFVKRLQGLLEKQANSALVKSTNAQGNTALHLAAQGGFPRTVEYLLEKKRIDANVRNKYNETALLKACESGDLDTVTQLCKPDPPSLRQWTEDKRTCLSVAINRGDSDLVNFILSLKDAKDLIQEGNEHKHGDTEDRMQEGNKHGDTEDLIQETENLNHVKYKDGDTALHLAVGRNDVHIIKRLIEIEPQLCYSVNNKKETPLCMAAKLGHLEAVKELIKCRPDAVEIADSCGMNVLHLAAQVSQVRIVDHLKEKVFLLDMVNKGFVKAPEENEKPKKNGGNTDPAGETDRFWKICEGDTPLHIAARQKCFNMVSALLRIRGINKFAVNREGLTALDIVRENTKYHESDKIISVLASYPPRRKPFMYSAPKVSAEKHEDAVKMVDKTYEDRRNVELVVAVLLATMSFTAAFTIPGSFVTEVDDKSDKNFAGSPIPSPFSAPPPSPVGFDKNLGSPILLGLDSFKLFLIFDCVAFFLSLLVVLMWQISTPITTGNKILFLRTTNILVCATFAFTAYGFMAAMYAMLDRRAHKLAWFILGACLIICGCGNLSFFYMAAKFSVKKARFDHLNGLFPFIPELVGEWMWTKLERWGLLDLLRRSIKKWLSIFYWNRNDDAANKKMAGDNNAKKEAATANEGKALSDSQV